MDTYKRHKVTFELMVRLVQPWVCHKFNLRHEDLHADGPVLLVSNHVTAWDPILVSMSLKDKHVYYVASEHIFRLGAVSSFLNWIVAPIPRKKASSGADTVKNCLRQLRQGHSVCLFAEGEQSWDGRTSHIFPATGKLVKSSGASLVTFRLEGAYLSLPRWARSLRRGAVYGHPVGIYSPEQLRSMDNREINALIEQDIQEDAWDRQRLNPVHYRGRRLAEGLERALYACPRCRRIGTLRTRDHALFCDCGFSIRYEETGFFSPPEPFQDLAEWEDWQAELLHNRDFPHSGELLFSDGGMELSQIFSDHSESLLETGVLLQYADRLVCGMHTFPLSDIRDMAMVQAHLLLFNFHGDYFQLRSFAGANLRKYLEIWKEPRKAATV